MLERELQGIRNDGNDPLVDGLRSGRRRSASVSDDNHQAAREQSLQNVLDHANGSSVGTARGNRGVRRRSASLSEDNCLNSTSNNSVVIHTAEYSSIVRPGNLPRRTTDMHDSYIESPISWGAGTRGIRTSEDDYEAEDVVQEYFENLFDEVDKFGCEHINKEGWKNSVEAEFKRIDTKILQFMQKLGLVGSDSSLKKARSLRSTLQNYRVTLTKRIRDEVNLTVERILNTHSYPTDSSSNTTSTTSETTGCTERQIRENDLVITTDDVFSDWCESSSQQSEDQHQALLPSNGQNRGPSAIPERMQCDQISDTPIRLAARKQSVNLISLIDCEKEKESGEKETSLNISISGILKELNRQDFFENDEARERIATFDLRIEEMLTQMKTSIEDNQKHNNDLASKVMSLTGIVTSQAESHEKMVEALNLKVKEHQSLRNDVNALQSDCKSLSSSVSSVKQQIQRLKTEITENQETQNCAVDDVKKSVNSALEKSNCASQDTLNLKTQIETLKAVLNQNMLNQNTAVESILQSIEKLKDDSDYQGLNIDVLHMELRDQNKEIHQILTSTACQDRVSDQSQPLRSVGNAYENSPTVIMSSAESNSKGANSKVTSDVTIVAASQSCQTDRTAHNSYSKGNHFRQGGTTLLLPEIVHTHQTMSSSNNHNQARNTAKTSNSVFDPETVNSGPVSSNSLSTNQANKTLLAPESVSLGLELSNAYTGVRESNLGTATHEEEYETAQTIEQENLESLVSQLNLLTVLQSSVSSEDLIKESKNQTIPAIVKPIPMVFNGQTKYISYGNADRETCRRAKKATKDANDWIETVTKLYNESEKPSSEDNARLVKGYLPSFDTTQPILVGFVESPSVNASLHLTKTRSVNLSEHDITINTQTGEKKEINLNKNQITIGHSNPPVYITQWLQIGTSKCLCFFDTGADINMIDGGVAEKEGLRVITDHPTTLKVVGGSELVTDYGKYMLNIGPTPESNFKQLVCHGMTSVAGPFPKFDLTEVNREIRSMNIVTEEEKLPDFVSGSVVHLLIGISESATQPVHVTTLPSGLSIYRSPFTDIFGSNICYGGTYESPIPSSECIATNQQVHLINSLQVEKESLQTHTMEIVKEYESDLLPLPIYDNIEDAETRKIHYTYEIDKEVTTQIFPTPLTSKDFSDPECFLVLDNEVSEVQENTSSADQNVKSKDSGKSRAVLLLASMEQEIIEKPVTMDRSKRKVFVDLPFTKDPDPFLTKIHHAKHNLRSAKVVHDQPCRQPQIHNEEMRKAHEELVSCGFMIKVSDLDEKMQKIITEAPLRHYYPCEKASSNGESLKMLGYKWTPREDTLSPGLSEMNFNKEIRGSKKPNVKLVATKEDASDLIGAVILTRKNVASKVADIYDPGGQKRVWSQSVKSHLGYRMPRSRNRTPAPKGGRSQEQKEVVFVKNYEEVVRDPSIPLCARSHRREANEHEPGGRVSKAGGRKKMKGAASRLASKLKPFTQHAIEEEGIDFKPEPEYFTYDF